MPTGFFVSMLLIAAFLLNLGRLVQNCVLNRGLGAIIKRTGLSWLVGDDVRKSY